MIQLRNHLRCRDYRWPITFPMSDSAHDVDGNRVVRFRLDRVFCGTCDRPYVVARSTALRTQINKVRLSSHDLHMWVQRYLLVTCVVLDTLAPIVPLLWNSLLHIKISLGLLTLTTVLRATNINAACGPDWPFWPLTGVNQRGCGRPSFSLLLHLRD